MSQVYFSTYEGDIIGYEMEIDDLEVNMKQIINSPESKHPVRNLIILGKQLVSSSNNNVNIYEVTGGSRTNTIETKYHIKLLVKLQHYFLTVGDNIIELRATQSQTLRTYHTKQPIIDVKPYNETTFLVLTKTDLLAFGLNGTNILSNLDVRRYNQSFLQLQVLDEQHVLLMSDRCLLHLNLKTYEAKHFELPGKRIFNVTYVSGQIILLGCKDGVLLTLSSDLEILHKKQIPEGFRPKSFFQVIPELLCCICNKGHLMFLICESNGELLELHSKELTRNVIAGTAYDFQDQEESEEEFEEAEELEEFEENTEAET